jgi:hypothetical protein
VKQEQLGLLVLEKLEPQEILELLVLLVKQEQQGLLALEPRVKLVQRE